MSEHLKKLRSTRFAFRKYWFIESAVLLGIWIAVIVCNKGDFGAIINIYWGLSGTSEGLVFDREGKKIIGSIYVGVAIFAIFMNIWKRMTVCKTLTCYCEENSKQFKKETRWLNLAIGASSLGLAFATPLVYILSFVFRILFWKIIKKEETSCRIENLQEKSKEALWKRQS